LSGGGMKKFLSKSRLGFTLMEVNLAVFIMAVGVLAMVSLYPLAFRESQ
jgi:Tfp pilus assembly protein PilV